MPRKSKNAGKKQPSPPPAGNKQPPLPTGVNAVNVPAHLGPVNLINPPSPYISENEWETIHRYLDYTAENEKPHFKKQHEFGRPRVLIIAEKPSVARNITKVLSGSKQQEKKNKDSLPVSSFSNKLFGKQAQFTVTSVVGHLFQVDFPQEYKNWEAHNPRTLFTAPIENVLDNESNVESHLISLVKDKDVVILWMDNDLEGENICFEVLDVIFGHLKESKYRRIYRATSTSLNGKSLIEALASLDDGPDLYAALSVTARQVIDLKVGVALTRYFTLNFSNKFFDRKKILSYGPCQIPALNLVVQHDDKILEGFKPTTYYKVRLFCTLKKSLFQHFAKQKPNFYTDPNFLDFLASQKGLAYFELSAFDSALELITFDSKKEAEKFIRSLSPNGKILGVEVNSIAKKVPDALNTFNLIKYGCDNWGVSANEVLDEAVQLYNNGYITYPRTESTTYSADHNFRRTLNILGTAETKYSDWAKFVSTKKHLKSNPGNKLVDHEPIAPGARIPTIQGLKPLQQKIYLYIVNNFIASLDGPGVDYKKVCRIKFGNIEITHTTIIEETDYENQRANNGRGQTFRNDARPSNGNDDLDLQQHDMIYLLGAEIDECVTRPPHLKESDLVGLMEANKIGTDGSIAKHIETLINRGYIQVVDKKTRELASTTLGVKAIEIFSAAGDSLVKTTMRREMEEFINQIEKKKDFKVYERVVENMLAKFCKEYDLVATQKSALNRPKVE